MQREMTSSVSAYIAIIVASVLGVTALKTVMLVTQWEQYKPFVNADPLLLSRMAEWDENFMQATGWNSLQLHGALQPKQPKQMRTWDFFHSGLSASDVNRIPQRHVYPTTIMLPPQLYADNMWRSFTVDDFAEIEQSFSDGAE